MNVGQLFVSLGVKGSDKALGAVSGVRKSLKDTASVGLETKAAILGAVYALQQMFSKSGQYGTDLTNFNATIGVSAKTLQQYQYAARQVGVSNQAVEGTFRSLQSTITKQLMGEQAPKGLARVAELLSQAGVQMSQFDLAEFANNPEKLIQRLQQYAQLEKHAGRRNEVLKSFGVGEDMIAALTRNAFKPDVMAKAPTYSDKEVQSLDKANIAWSNLGNKIEMAFGRFNAQHGNELVNGISKITDQVLKLSDAFMNMANHLKLFEKFGLVIEGWTHIFNGLTTSVNAANEALSDPKKAESLKENLKDELGLWMNLLSEKANEAFGDILGGDKGPMKNYKPEYEKDDSPSSDNAAKKKKRKPEDEITIQVDGGVYAPKAEPEPAPRAEPARAPGREQEFDKNSRPGEQRLRVVPKTPEFGGASAVPSATPAVTNQTNNNNTTVNQNLNFTHPGTDPKRTADSVKQAAQRAIRQMPATAQGS